MHDHDRICHDAAHVATLSIMECIANCIRPEEYAIAYEEIFLRVKTGIEAYVAFMEPLPQRLVPGRN